MSSRFPDYAQWANLPWIEEAYSRYVQGPDLLEPSWRHFFEGIDFAEAEGGEKGCPTLRILELLQAYRRYGHLEAKFNPLSSEKKIAAQLSLDQLGFAENELDTLFPSLGFCKEKEAPLREILAALSHIYCNRIGFEVSDLDNPELEKAIRKKIEPGLCLETSFEEKKRILEALNESEIFEIFLNTKYVGQKRFSLEGVETALLILAELVEESAHFGVLEFFIGMAHRGRLNVLSNLLKKPYSLIFREFEDTFALLEEGSGDVKYHKGFSSELLSRAKLAVTLHLCPNASHLESVDPIVLGQTKARQQDKSSLQVCPILLHGDAAFAGQGVVYEILQLSKLSGYRVGGTIHLILNNQLGFTTEPVDAYSTRYPTDIAKAFHAPIFHVNAEDPESCLFVAKMAAEIRAKFQCDVFIDLNGYRKYGHNEGDEPTFTQPLMYQQIRKKKTIRDLYRQELLSHNHLEQELAEELEKQFQKKLQEAFLRVKEKPELESKREKTNQSPFEKIVTKIDPATLEFIVAKSSEVPPGFHLHPKLQKWLEERKDLSRIDWSLAEWLAFGSLLLEGTSVRFAGQDTQRGTFSHRQMAWVDQVDGHRTIPLDHLKEGQAHFELINSPLSEYAAMGFELGYSWSSPQSLVLWEAQFGDFFNGAQIIIDQYLSAAEQKWQRTSSLVLLLPHGYEGQGPEHSSARLERFLQLCANDNLQIANLTTPAQFFHLLRRQAKRSLKKPLIVFTPKSLLRSPKCISSLKDFSEGSFQEILDDSKETSAQRILLCSGHVYFDLVQEREKLNAHVAIFRLEQLYPLHLEQLKNMLLQYPSASEIVWVQEEPKNMGAWGYLRAELQQLLSGKQHLRYAGRLESASTAAGSHLRHEEEKRVFLDEAFG